MEVGVDDRRMPPDDHAAPDADLEIADERGLLEIAMIADLDPCLRADVEHHPVHRAARSDDQPGVEPAAEQSKGAVARQVVAGDEAVRPEAHVRREGGVVHGQPALTARRSPPARPMPRRPATVAYPCGRRVTKSCAYAALAASTISSRLAPGRP